MWNLYPHGTHVNMLYNLSRVNASLLKNINNKSGEKCCYYIYILHQLHVGYFYQVYHNGVLTLLMVLHPHTCVTTLLLLLQDAYIQRAVKSTRIILYVLNQYPIYCFYGFTFPIQYIVHAERYPQITIIYARSVFCMHPISIRKLRYYFLV